MLPVMLDLLRLRTTTKVSAARVRSILAKRADAPPWALARISASGGAADAGAAVPAPQYPSVAGTATWPHATISGRGATEGAGLGAALGQPMPPPRFGLPPTTPNLGPEPKTLKWPSPFQGPKPLS